ncbi:4-hydroxybenzoate octaprenyltransferase [Lentisalinibacter orientalis]|uniref:4-hydroxybenzoate octaprenyltransferase n=1 Tax=Lentisalinibacter orientalis TaxID=2992241 RepID=UPI00386A0709
MRLDRPIGFYLLMWPTLWALWVAGDGRPDEGIFAIFMAGVVVTRCAGCIINDIADRGFDPYVTRTRERPLATGKVSVVEAALLFVGLGLIAVGLVTLLNPLSRVVAAAAAVLMIVYPFVKRILSVPQLVLGAAFAMAIPLAFAAQTGEIPEIAWLMFAVTVIWAIIYDTMYAMVDRPDDLQVGIKSTAILFGDADRFMIGALQGLMLLGLVLMGTRLSMGLWYFLGVALAAGFMAWHQYLIRDRDTADCFRAFLNNHYIGMMVFIGIALDYLFR